MTEILEVTGMNYRAMAVAWLIAAVVGAFWYSRVGFGRQWMRHTGIDLLEMPDDLATRLLGSVVVAALVQVVMLAIVINSLGAITVADGLVAGVVLWAGYRSHDGRQHPLSPSQLALLVDQQQLLPA